jgi:hypothetical protein
MGGGSMGTGAGAGMGGGDMSGAGHMSGNAMPGSHGATNHGS